MRVFCSGVVGDEYVRQFGVRLTVADAIDKALVVLCFHWMTFRELIIVATLRKIIVQSMPVIEGFGVDRKSISKR